jgi:hypothetical protein
MGENGNGQQQRQRLSADFADLADLMLGGTANCNCNCNGNCNDNDNGFHGFRRFSGFNALGGTATSVLAEVAVPPKGF